MVRPRVIVREKLADVDWEEVRSLVICELAKFDFSKEAGMYSRHMLNNDPKPGYCQAMKLAAAALLRILKLHPASSDYSVGGTYCQLVTIATIEGVEYPDQDGLRFLHRSMLRALVMGAGSDEGLGNDPFASTKYNVRSIKAAPEMEQATEQSDVAFRRIRIDDPP